MKLNEEPFSSMRLRKATASSMSESVKRSTMSVEASVEGSLQLKSATYRHR